MPQGINIVKTDLVHITTNKSFAVSEEVYEEFAKTLQEQIDAEILVDIMITASPDKDHIKYYIPSIVDHDEVVDWVKDNATEHYTVFKVLNMILFTSKADYEWTFLRWQ